MLYPVELRQCFFELRIGFGPMDTGLENGAFATSPPERLLKQKDSNSH